MKSKRDISTFLGFVLAIYLFVLAFRNVAWSELRIHLMAMDMNTLAFMVALSVAGLFFRGIRWWLLLARPVARHEFWGIQRAMAVSYAVGNVVSRLAELVRIVIAHQETRRDIPALTGTVVLDRLVFDGAAFGLMLLLALGFNREALISLLPEALPFVKVLFLLLIAGTAGLLLTAFSPSLVKGVLEVLRIQSIPKIGTALIAWVDKMHQGLQVLARPKYLVLASLVNGFVWFLPFYYFIIALHAFGVEASYLDMGFVFILTVVGVLIPSPGGVGSYHFMVTLGLTGLMHLDPNRAGAFALVTHGVNYGVLFLVGLPCFFLSRKAVNRRMIVEETVR